MRKFVKLCTAMIILNGSLLCADINERLTVMKETINRAKEYGYREPKLKVYVDHVRNDVSFIIMDGNNCIGAHTIGTLDDSYELEDLKLKAMNLKIKYAKMFYESKLDRDKKDKYWNSVKKELENL